MRCGDFFGAHAGRGPACGFMNIRANAILESARGVGQGRFYLNMTLLSGGIHYGKEDSSMGYLRTQNRFR